MTSRALLLAAALARGSRPACRSDFVVGSRARAALRIEPALALVSIQNGAPATARFRGRRDRRGPRHRRHGAGDDRLDLGQPAARERRRDGRRDDGHALRRRDVDPRERWQGATASARLRVRFVLQTSVPPATGAPALPAAPAQALAGPRGRHARARARLPERRRAAAAQPLRDRGPLPPRRAANTLFEVGFANALTDVRAYTRCAPVGDAIDPGCLYAPTRDVWTGLAETNRGADPLTLTVRATDDAGAGVGASRAQTLRFAPADVRGALYYWTTSQGSAIMRWNFGDATRTMAERFAGPEASGDPSVFCVGCHALSHDGGKMVLGTSLTNAATGGSDRRLAAALRRRAPRTRRALPARAAEHVRGLGAERRGVRRRLRRRRREGPPALRRHDGRAHGHDPARRRAGRSPRLVVRRRAHRLHGGRRHAHRPGARARRHQLRRGRGRRVVGAAAPRAERRRQEPLLPRHRARRQLPRLRRVDLPRGQDVRSRVQRRHRSERASLRGAPSRPRPPTPVELAAANAPGVADRGATDLGTSYPKWNPFAFHVSVAEPDPLAHVLVAASLRPAPVAAAGVVARGPARGDAHLDGRHRSGAPRQGRGSERAGVLPAVPGHHDVEPHRAVDGRRRARSPSVSPGSSAARPDSAGRRRPSCSRRTG